MANKTTIDTAGTRQVEEMAAKAVLLRLTVRRMGSLQRLDSSAVEADIDEDRLRASAKLFRCEEMEDIESLDSKVRRKLMSLVLESDLKPGLYLVPVKILDKVYNLLDGYLAKRKALVERFVANYPAIVAQERAALREEFRERRYGGPAVLAALAEVENGEPYDEERRRIVAAHVEPLFCTEYSFFTYATPGSLASISRELYEQEREKAALWWEEAKASARAALREALRGMIAHLVERLEGERVNKKGEIRKKVIKESSVQTLLEFLDTFGARNIADDEAMQRLVAQAKQVIQGVKIDDLRNDDGVREAVREGFTEVARELDRLVVEAPRRRIVLD